MSHWAKTGGWAGCWQTFIVEAILVTWLLKFLFCLFVCLVGWLVFFLLIHMEHKYLPILFPKTSIYIPSSRLFFHESYNCAPNHSTKPLATFHELVSSWSFGISPYRQKQTGNYPDWTSAFYWKSSPYAQLTGRLNKNRRSECGARKMYWGPCKERSGSCLKNPNLIESPQWSPFLESWGRSMVRCLNILVSEP